MVLPIIMYYKMLSEQYLEEAEALRIYVKNLKKENSNKREKKYEENYYRISILYGMYLDLKHIGEYLHKKCEAMKDGKKSFIPG